MKKALTRALALVMVIVLLAGCGSQKNPEASEGEKGNLVNDTMITDVNKTGTGAYSQAETRYPLLRYAITEAPTSLLPWQPSGNVVPVSMCYESLMSYDDDLGDYVFNIGIEWIKVDELHWQMPIHDNVYDSDGNNLTAQDVVKCYERQIETGNATKFDVFESITAVDTYTVEFTWNTPIDRVGLLDRIVGLTYLYTDQAYNDHELAVEVCGTGPYKVVEYTSGSKIVVEARDDYWNDNPTTPYSYRNVQRVEFPVIMEATQNSIALATNAIDFTESIPADDLAKFIEGGEYSENYQVLISANTDIAYFCANRHEDAPHADITNDINFNLALFYALDNESIAQVADNCVPATSADGSYYRSAHGDHVNAWDDEENYVTVYNPELAKEYLAKSSYKGETLYLLTGTDDQKKNACVMVQALLENIGVYVEINPLEGNLEGIARKDPTQWDLMLGTFGGPRFVDAINKIVNYNESGNGYSYNYVRDETLQELFETARGIDTHDDEHTTELYHYILENAYYDFLFVKAKTCVYSKDIVNPFFNLTTGLSLEPQGCTYAVD